MKIGICTMENFDNRPVNSVGSSRIRARWLLPYWDEAEEYMIGQKYDVLIFQKVYWENMMENFEGIKILDLCDPDWLEGRDVFKYIDMCDAVTTSTQTLADFIQKMRPKAVVKCIPDRIYLPEHKPRVKPHIGPAQNILWYGYHHNTHYLMKTFDELLKQNMHLTIVSNSPYQPPRAYAKLNITNLPYSYPEIHDHIAESDLVLMPDPDDDAKGRFKSNNKTLTAWALKVPVVKTADDLDRLMDGETRQKEAEERYKEVVENYDVRLSVKEYNKLISNLKTQLGS